MALLVAALRGPRASAAICGHTLGLIEAIAASIFVLWLRDVFLDHVSLGIDVILETGLGLAQMEQRETAVPAMGAYTFTHGYLIQKISSTPAHPLGSICGASSRSLYLTIMLSAYRA